MRNKRLLQYLTLCAPALFGCAGSWALGLDTGPHSVVLGQPLDFTVGVRLDAEESLSADCVQAEVSLGEHRIASSAVRTRVSTAGNQGVIRVSTTSAIDEPVVTVHLAAGCSARVNRRYVVFADPSSPAPSVAPMALPQAETVADSVASGVPPAGWPAAQAVTPVAGGTPHRAAPTQRATVQPAASVAQTRRATRIAAQREARARAAKSPSVRSAAAAAPEKAQPRLKLDPAEAVTATQPAAIEAAFEAVAEAASAARAAASAASASAQRIAALEQTVERVRGEARTSQAEVERLRALLNRPQISDAWTWPLLFLLAAVTLAALWLVWRLRALQRAQEAAWARASALALPDPAPKETAPQPLITAAPSTSPVPLTRAESPTLPKAPAVAATPMPTPAASLADAGPDVDPTMARTVVLPPTARVDETLPRDVSIEELIDVDQQAEFFMALGQEAAAIELLVAHLRSTGGGSPLTYLKLLEIYRHCGDAAAYERTRARFNHRYNAYAPEWGVDLTHGKTLEDYPGVIPRLQQVWAKPLDAMAELEALLFRKSRGELFELPAYRDVLFLYSLARDLLEREPSEATHVDLLLPLDDGVPPSGLVGNSRAVSDVPPEERPTAPVDLDLTPPRVQDSIFGELLASPPGHGAKSDRRP